MLYPGTWLVLSLVAFILVCFALGAYWAATHGQFDDVEAAKYSMLENERRQRDHEYRERRD